MAENAHRRHTPFEQFINFNLNMTGVDGISFETVALAMREIMHELPTDSESDLEYGELDRLQDILRSCLSVEAIGRLIQRNPELMSIDPHELDRIISMTITMSFVCYNQLAERFGFERPELTKSRDDVKRLWSTLRAASGWVNKAAASGDAIAARMASEIDSTLEDIEPPDWSNNTRTLPH